MDKYQNAIFQYESWRQKIKELTASIGEAAQTPIDNNGNGGMSLCENIGLAKSNNSIPFGGITCIEAMWDMNRELATDYEDDDEVNTPADLVGDYEPMCKSCEEVQKLVDERKAAKQQFGIAKRRLSQIGKGLI